MRWSDGTKHSPANDNRQSNSVSSTYTVYIDGSTIYAEANMPGKSDTSGSVATTVLQFVMDALD